MPQGLKEKTRVPKSAATEKKKGREGKANKQPLTTLEKIYRFTYSNKFFLQAMDAIAYFAVVATVTSYILTLVSLVFLKSDILLAVKFVLVTGVPFVLVSVFRHIFNAPRPYELTDFSDFAIRLPGNKKGRSFPSRHMFSSFVIGTSLLFIHVPVAILLLALGLFLGVWRVFRGIHFPRDIVAGGLIGGISGVLGMLLVTLI